MFPERERERMKDRKKVLTRIAVIMRMETQNFLIRDTFSGFFLQEWEWQWNMRAYREDQKRKKMERIRRKERIFHNRILYHHRILLPFIAIDCIKLLKRIGGENIIQTKWPVWYFLSFISFFFSFFSISLSLSSLSYSLFPYSLGLSGNKRNPIFTSEWIPNVRNY